MTVASDQLHYAVKYVPISVDGTTGEISFTEPTIIDDVDDIHDGAGTDWNFVNNAFVPVPEEWLALPVDGTPKLNMGIPPGWAFLDGTPTPGFGAYHNSDPSINNPKAISGPNGVPALNVFPDYLYFVDGGYTIEPSIDPNKPTHTVTISKDYALCVAFWNSDPAREIAINFFDFSQEPDHEYVELVNTSDAEVDLSGWELEIGAPDQGDVEDPFKSVWQVPDNVRIAPKGMLLLSFESSLEDMTSSLDKFDMYRTSAGISHLTSLNGMGVACSTLRPDTDKPDIKGVTVPPFKDKSKDYLNPLFYDQTGSVFEREESASGKVYDYVDRDGDGVTSYPLVSEEGGADTDRSVLENELTQSTEASWGLEEQPWDRIVPMKCVRLWKGDETDTPWNPKAAVMTLYDITDVDDLARLILKGGVLPNYPEHDGIDNDGDGGFLQYDAEGTLSGDPTFKYIPGILDKDGVDNDLDDSIDERGRDLYSFMGMEISSMKLILITILGGMMPRIRKILAIRIAVKG